MSLQHRISAWSYAKGRFGRIFGHLIWLRLVRHFGCYVSPRAQIGPGLRLPHPTSIIIGDGVKISENVTIFQNVTLGSRDGISGYPTVDSDVVIFTGAVIIGDIRIGTGATIGANAVVIRDVAPGSVVAGIPAAIITPRKQTTV